MSIRTQSYGAIHEEYEKALDWMREIGVNISPGRTQHYARLIEYWKTNYLTASAQEAKDAFPDFVSGMSEICDFIDVYRSLHLISKSDLSRIAEKLQKGVNGPINSSQETNKSSAARNFIFEVLVAARFHEPNNSIEAILDSRNDTGIRIDKKKIWVECKRITSVNKLEANVRDACGQLERTLKGKVGSGHRGMVAIDFTKILHKGDKILVKSNDDSLRFAIKEVMDSFIKQHSNQWEKVYLSKDRKICGTLLRFSTMATSESSKLLVRASEWAICLKGGINSADEMLLRQLKEALPNY